MAALHALDDFEATAPCEADRARAEARRALARLGAVPYLTMSKREHAAHITELQQIAATVDAIRAEASAEAHDATVHLMDGQTGLPAFVSSHTNADPKQVAGDRNLGQWLQSFPVVADAFREGRISRSHAQALRKLDNRRTHRDLIVAQDYLVEVAETASWRDFTEVLAVWLLRADPDGNEPHAQKEKRGVLASKRSDGMVAGTFLLEPVPGDLFLNALAQEGQRLPADADPDAPTTPAQRRADALVSLVGKGATRPDGTVAAPLVHITMGEDVAADLLARLAIEQQTQDPIERRAALLALGLNPDVLPLDPSRPEGRCHLADGTPIHPRQALAALAVGTLRKLVLSADDEVLRLGRSVRDFPRHFKDAVIAANKGRCNHAGCDAPMTWLEADHRIPWGRGGQSNIDVCDPLCKPHNRRKGTDLPP